METSLVPPLGTDSDLSIDSNTTTSVNVSKRSRVESDTSVSSCTDSLTITKSIKVAANVEIPIHIPIAQPLHRQSSGRGRRKHRNVGPKQKIQPKVRDTLKKIMPTPLPTVFIKTTKSVSDTPNLMENVMNDPTIQEMLKQNPGHTLTLVRLPDGQVPPIQLDNLPSSETVLIEDQPVQVHLSNQATSSPGRMPGRAGRKRKRRKTEESDDENSEEEGQEEGEEEVVQKVTRSGRVIKPPSYRGKYYVGLKGKTFKGADSIEEKTQTGNSDVNGMKKNVTSLADPNLRHVKRGPGRPRKHPLPENVRSSEEFRDPVSRSQILRLSKEVSCWDFMLMRAAGQCTGKLGKSFYSELLKEFKTLLVNMRRLSGSLLCEIPESSGLDDGEEDNGIVRISEILSSSLGQRIGSFKVETPSQENLPRRVLHWLGADAVNFPEKKEGESTLLTPTTLSGVESVLPQEDAETAESLLQSVESFDTQPGVLNLVEPTLSSQEELANDPTLQDPTEPLMTTQVQGALVPQGSVIMEMEDGTFMAQTPDGATMEIQAPDSMTLETLSELLDQATGALAATSQNDETVMPPSESLEKEAISPEDAVMKDSEILSPPAIPRTMIGNLQVKRSIELSKSRVSKPATILLQT